MATVYCVFANNVTTDPIKRETIVVGVYANEIDAYKVAWFHWEVRYLEEFPLIGDEKRLLLDQMSEMHTYKERFIYMQNITLEKRRANFYYGGWEYVVSAQVVK